MPFAVVVVVSETPEGFGCCTCGRKAPEKAKLDFVISRLLGRRRIMKQLARIKYSLVEFVATFKCLDGFSSRVAQALPQRHVDCADYIGLGGLA